MTFADTQSNEHFKQKALFKARFVALIFAVSLVYLFAYMTGIDQTIHQTFSDILYPPPNCSNQGILENSSCVCDLGFTGSSCSLKQVEKQGVPNTVLAIVQDDSLFNQISELSLKGYQVTVLNLGGNISFPNTIQIKYFILT